MGLPAMRPTTTHPKPGRMLCWAADDKENDEDGHAPAATHAGSGGADEKGKGKVPEQEDKGERWGVVVVPD